MSVTTASLPLPTVPSDALDFAAAHGQETCLPEVLALARRIFPQSPMRVMLADDPEIADYRHIVVEVNVADWDVSLLVAAQDEWSEAIIQICPSAHGLAFVLRMV